MFKLDRRIAGAALLLGLLEGSAAAQTDTPATSAAPAPAAAPAAPVPAAGETLTGAAAWELLKGNTISGRSGGETFMEYFEAGGGVKYVDKDGVSTGTWTLQANKVCFDFPEDDDRSCSVFTVTGTSGSAVDDDGETARFTIQPGNAKGL